MLCERCRGFDVRALFVAAAAASFRSPDLLYHHGAISDQREGIYQFYELHPNLTALKVSAEECELCSAICKQYIRLRQDAELTADELKSDVSLGPIHLGIDDWEAGRSRAPHVIVSQYSSADPGKATAGRRLAYFDVCSTPGKEPTDQQNVLGRIQASCASDIRCLDLAKSWLKQCHGTHTLCSTAGTSLALPTRVLDLGREPDKVFLVDGQAHSGPYAALSYCWGGERELVLEDATKDAFENGLGMESLPPTLRDAVRVTQSLGVQFLWIDAMCIFQDSKEDWAKEASQMDAVYRGSFVTIEAASASKPSEGFLGERVSSKPYVELEWRPFATAPASVQLRPIHDIAEMQLIATKVFSRGWTLQERLLAPRTLSFGQQQISFECANGYQDEAGTLAELPKDTEYYLSKRVMHSIRCEQGFITATLRRLARLLGVAPSIHTRWGDFCIQGSVQIRRYSRGSYYDYWRELVEHFTERELSHETDRLPALAGVAKEIQRATGDTYCAGMWQSELLFSLTWSTSPLQNAASERNKQTDACESSTFQISEWPDGIQSSEYRAPSWSWASIKGRVEFLIGRGRTFVHLARILRVSLKPRFEDPFGCLAQGYLDVAGPVLRLPNVMIPCERTYQWYALHDYINQNSMRFTEHLATEVYQRHQTHENQQFALMQLLTSLGGVNCLLLETCGDGTWRRLCIIQVQVEGIWKDVESTKETNHMVPLTRKHYTYLQAYGKSDEEVDLELARGVNRRREEGLAEAREASRRQEIAEHFYAAPWEREIVRIV